ncbi:Serine/threonine-protein kinase ulk3 [Blomia tropicalis]|nr:Serine/threonine-protein kinase ulk3 [Blomia tropicalis]
MITNKTVINRDQTTNSTFPKPSIKGYIFGELVGKGTYGYVFRAKRVGPNVSKDPVAIKCILLTTLSKTTQNNVITEISILKQFKHQFIVQMLDFQWDKNFIYLIFEYCSGGELATVINLKRCFPEEIVQHFLQQLASALKFLRANDIAHMDLKPQNILISGISFVNLLNELNSFKVWRNVVLKIADFGFAQHLSDEEISTSFRGSPLYMAPEILLGHEYDARVDLWSIGVILYQCLFGHTPYSCTSSGDLINKFRTKKIRISIPAKPKISQNCRDLLKRLLTFDPKKRISFEDFFDHPFLDLEHIPNELSYTKATRILEDAIKEEKNRNYLQAFYLYRDAVFYLMPLYKWGDRSGRYTAVKEESLKQQVSKYLERAELLQQKCSLKSIDPNILSEIENIYNIIDDARELAQNSQLEQSLTQYESAIEKALKILKESDNVVRTEFFGEINDWMTEAENVKMLKQESYLQKNRFTSLKETKTKMEKDSNEIVSSSVDPTTDGIKEHIFNKATTSVNLSSFKQMPPKTSESKWRKFITENSTKPNDTSSSEDINKVENELSCNIQ